MDRITFPNSIRAVQAGNSEKLDERCAEGGLCDGYLLTQSLLFVKSWF